jgi:hypothetical protein
VPVKLATLLDTTISLRQIYSDDVSEVLEDSAVKRDSDDKHAFFLGVLKEVQHIIRSRLPRERARMPQPQATEEIFNLFEHLELEEPSAAFEQAPDNIPVRPEQPIYMAERPNDMEESFFAFALHLHDLSKLRSEVSTAWAGYKNGMHDLVAAAITTNTAVDLARSMTDDLKSTFVKNGGACRMLQIYYAAQCMATGTSAAHKMLPGDDMNFATYKLAESLFYPAHQLLNAFCNVLKVMPTPEMKRGIYGFYKPGSDRNRKSDREKFMEDKILMLEMLP